jgi:hypothetical protein
MESGMYEMVGNAADQLCRIDDRAFRRAQLLDANSILSKIVLPMSIPWTHKIEAHRIIPRDIDELDGVIAAEAEFPAESRLGEIQEVPGSSASEHQLVSTIRSNDDPGVVEFTRTLVPLSIDLSTERPRGIMREGAPADSEGELSLRFMDEVQRRKRRRLGIIAENTKRLKVSIRFGGVSSRATLRPNVGARLVPCELLATLPQELLVGRKVDWDRAAENAAQLGSYDLRHGLPRMASISKRVKSGRTRLMWSSKQSRSQRSHKSLLTGTSLETGQQRRPLDVKVFIRLNGQVVTVDKSQKSKIPIDGDDEWAGSAYSERTVALALDKACEHEQSGRHRERLQCSLVFPAYSKKIWERTSINSEFMNVMQEPFFVKVTDNEQLWLDVRPPRVWSHPCEDGVFSTVCTETGEMNGIQYSGSDRAAGSSKAYPWATAVFLDAVAKLRQTCCICWSNSDGISEELVLCKHCQVRVHPKCYFGEKTFDPDWCCDSCVDYQNRASSMPGSLTATNVRWARVCRLCPQFGGAIAQRRYAGGAVVETPRSWEHVHCRMWKDAAAYQGGVCTLCSKHSANLVRCAAVGCSILFHPMCSVVASHAAASRRASDSDFLHYTLDFGEDRDAFLATQYSHEMVDISIGKKRSKKRWQIPVAYCGLHNPQRARDRYGLLQGAVFFDDSVRLPLDRKKIVALP